MTTDRNVNRRPRTREGNVDAREFEVQALLADAAPDTVLQHVFIDASDPTYYVVKAKSGKEVLRVSKADVKRSRSPAERITELLYRLVCADCGEVLYVGEEGICGPCEGRQLRELLELRNDLA